MNIGGLVSALLPVFFVLALGYFAGKRNAFDSDQAAGLSKLALSFALPASLFVSMTDIPKDLLLQQGRLVLALILSHAGLFLIAWFALGYVKSLRGTPAIIYALMLSTSATPVFGLAVLGPILGPTSAGTVGLVALAINLTVPPAVILLEMDAAAKNKQAATGPSQPSAILTGLNAGLKSPLLWAPILGIAVVLAGIHLPPVVASCFELIGSATSGVAVFAVGLILAAHPVRLSPGVFAGSFARITAANESNHAGPGGKDPRTLGKLLLFDKHLSVNENEACSFCHSADTGFTGGIQSLNLTTVSYPGSVRTRFSQRKPQSYMYAPFAPVLHYKSLQRDLVGGNFWDMRASGYRLQSPSAEQALGPPTNPVEMGLPDSACLAYRLSKAPYRKLFEQIWGADSFSIAWPAGVERVCSTPGPPLNSDLYPVHLSAADRQRTDQVYDGFGLAVAAYEASPEVSPFASKYDFVQPGKGVFTAEEARGYALFRGKARCNECHRDDGPGEEPLFTDFTASNLGVPRNPALQFYFEAAADKRGYSANPKGASYTDTGVGYFLNKLTSLSGQLNPNSQWIGLASEFDGKFQVPTLRDVDMRPNPQFVKAFMHNGYFKSLKEVIHFYNTRDVLPTCKPGDPGEKITCWPPPEYPINVNKRQLGDLKLTDQEENDLVAFLKTLTDDYSGRYQWIWGDNSKTSSPMPKTSADPGGLPMEAFGRSAIAIRR